MIEINHQLENDLKENNQLFFDKTKQADDLDRQLQIINNEYQDIKIKFNQIQEDKTKLIENFAREKIETTEVRRKQKHIFIFVYHLFRLLIN